MLDANIFSKYKTKQDFDRERAEFEARKRQQALQEQLGQVNLEKAQRELSQPSLPFQGTGFDSQIANEAYKFNLAKGLDDATARQQAVDMVLGSKTDYSPIKDPYTGQTTLMPRPRQGIFGQQESVMQPMPVQQASNQMDAQVDQLLPQESLVAQTQMPAAPVQNQPIDGSIPIDPRALQSPEVQMDLAKKQGAAAIALQAAQMEKQLENRPARS